MGKKRLSTVPDIGRNWTTGEESAKLSLMPMETPVSCRQEASGRGKVWLAVVDWAKGSLRWHTGLPGAGGRSVDGVDDAGGFRPCGFGSWTAQIGRLAACRL